MRVDLQLFGGRGAVLGASAVSRTRAAGGSGAGKLPSKTYTAAELKGMSRSKLLQIAEPYFVRFNPDAGRISTSEAIDRFRALSTGKGNTDAQIRKTILSYQRRAKQGR